MENHFILDTNAYRQLAEQLETHEIEKKATELKEKEKEHNSKSIMSVVVSMELFKHFKENDPSFLTCFKGLALQFFHTQSKNYGENNNNIDFIPPINPLLTKHFFERNCDELKYYFRIIELLDKATNRFNPKDYLDNKEDIELIAKHLIYERTEMKDNFEEFIKDINEGVLDWEVFLKRRDLKKIIIKDIENGKLVKLFALSLLQRAHKILNLDFQQPNLEEKFNDFLIFYEPFLKLFQHLIEKLLHGVKSLADPLNLKWNTLNDMQIIAAACFQLYNERNNDVRIILVTDDQGIHKICEHTIMEDNVWKLNEYLKFLG